MMGQLLLSFLTAHALFRLCRLCPCSPQLNRQMCMRMLSQRGWQRSCSGCRPKNQHQYGIHMPSRIQGLPPQGQKGGFRHSVGFVAHVCLHECGSRCLLFCMLPGGGVGTATSTSACVLTCALRVPHRCMHIHGGQMAAPLINRLCTLGLCRSG